MGGAPPPAAGGGAPPGRVGRGETLLRCAPGLEGVVGEELGAAAAPAGPGGAWAGGVLAEAGLAPRAARALRSADTAWAFLWGTQDFPRDEEGAFRVLSALPAALDWPSALRTVGAWNPGLPLRGEVKFRATCVRDTAPGEERHGFRSMDAAGVLGEAVAASRGWAASMRSFHVEVMLWVRGAQALLGVQLLYAEKPGEPGVQQTHRAFARQLYQRPYLEARVRTTLRPSRAFALCQLAGVRPGDLVLDPACGAAVMPLEAASSFRSVWGLAGDLDPEAVQVAASNCRRGPPATDAPLWWDAANLPLRAGSVDVVVSDLPFGVACGKHRWVRHLLVWVIREAVRVLRPGSGRAVLLVPGPEAETFLHEVAAGKAGSVALDRVLDVDMEGIPVRAVLFSRTPAPAAAREFPSGSVARVLRTSKVALGRAMPQAAKSAGEVGGGGDARLQKKLGKRARKKHRRELRRQGASTGAAAPTAPGVEGPTGDGEGGGGSGRGSDGGGA